MNHLINLAAEPRVSTGESEERFVKTGECHIKSLCSFGGPGDRDWTRHVSTHIRWRVEENRRTALKCEENESMVTASNIEILQP